MKYNIPVIIKKNDAIKVKNIAFNPKLHAIKSPSIIVSTDSFLLCKDWRIIYKYYFFLP